MAEEKKERKILTITSVGTTKDIKIGNRDTKVIQFKATDAQGNELVYEAWDKEQVEQVKVNANLDCDITHTEKDGQTSHKVTQMYNAEGKPIRPITGRGGASRYSGKSPEDRKSIEDQVRAYIIADLWKSGLAPQNLLQKLTTWLEKLGVAEPKADTEAMKQSPPAKEPPLAKEPSAEPTVTKPKPITEPTLHNLADLVSERNYDTSYIHAYIMRIYKVDNARQLTEKDGQQLLEYLEKGEGIPKKEPEKLFED